MVLLVPMSLAALRATLIHQHLPIMANDPGPTTTVMELLVDLTATARVYPIV